MQGGAHPRTLLLSRRAFFAALATLLAAILAFPVLADHIGPHRTVTTFKWERLQCHYEAVYDPSGPGYYGCTLNLYQPPDGNCPSEGDVAPLFNPSACIGWKDSCTTVPCDISLDDSIRGCSEGETGCRAVEKTSELPPATVSGSISCSTPGSGGWCRGGAELSASGSEPLDGENIVSIEGTRNGETFACSGAACSVPLLEGANAFTFWARSSYGDTSYMGSANGKLDSVAPSLSREVSGTGGDGGWFVSEATVSAAASDPAPGSGLASLEVQVNGGVWSAYSGPIVLGDGEHAVGLRAADVAGNTAQTSQAVRVDTVPPELSLSAGDSFCPGCGQTLEIVMSVTDAGSEITEWTLVADGIAVANGTGPGSETLAWNGAGLGGGAHTLTLEARDAAGNSSSASQSFDIIVPTPKPDPPTDEPEQRAPPPPTRTAVGPATAPSPSPEPATTSPPGQTPSPDPEPTRTPITIPFAGLPAAPELPPDEGIPLGKLPVPRGEVSTTSTDGSSSPVFGAAALALAAAASAVGLSRLRRREKERAALRKEMAERNAAAEAREQAQQAGLAAAIAAAAATAATRARNLYENLTTRLPRMLPTDDLSAAAAKATRAAQVRATQLLENLSRLPRMLPSGDLPQPGPDQLDAAGQQVASGEASQEFDMAKWKQQDMAAAEAAVEAQRQQAYEAFRAQERMAYAVPPVPVVQERSWWERAVDRAREIRHNVLSWVDQHQTQVSLGVGLLAGVAGVGAIVLSGGTATPLVVAGWAALAAGTTVAAGTVGLNAYFGRSLGDNLLRNTGISIAGAAAPVVGHWLLTGGATSALLGAGNAAASACLRFPNACAVVGPALAAFDTIEQVTLSVQLAYQTAINDPRAPETALELQLELNDGGLPGNTAIRRVGDEIAEAAARHGDDVLDAAARAVGRHGNDAVELIHRRGDDAIAFLARHEDEALDLIARHGEDIVDVFGRYGDEGITIAERYGTDFIARSEKLGVNPAKILSEPPTGAQTTEGWLLGIKHPQSPVNQRPVYALSEDAIAAVAETSTQNSDSILFSIGFSRGAATPYDKVGDELGIGYFAAPDELYERFDADGALGDFWQINSHAIETAIEDRKIFLLNIPIDRARAAQRSSTFAEISLIEKSGYVVRSIGDRDLLVPRELLDQYLSIIEVAAPQILAPGG